MVKIVVSPDLQPKQTEDSMINRLPPDAAATVQPVEPAEPIAAELTEWQKKAAVEKQERLNILKLRQQNLASMVKNFSLNFTYIRQYDPDTGEFVSKGGATIAWVLPPRKGDSIIPVAIAWCHPNESFNRFLGRYYAAREFAAGRWTRIRLPKTAGASSQFKTLFGPLA